MTAEFFERMCSELESSRRRQTNAAIAAELYKALERLGADPDLLSVVGSWPDTLPDEEILSLLRAYNETGKLLHERQ